MAAARGSGWKFRDDLPCFVYGSCETYRDGLLNRLGGKLTRSIVKEFEANESGKWMRELDYVLKKPAMQEYPSSKGEAPTTSETPSYTRDLDHGGMTLQEFWQRQPDSLKGTKNELSLPEVAIARMYTGPWFQAINFYHRYVPAVLCCDSAQPYYEHHDVRKTFLADASDEQSCCLCSKRKDDHHKQPLHDWATCACVLFSAISKIATASNAGTVFRGVKEEQVQLPASFLEAGKDGFTGGVEPAPMSTTFDQGVAQSFAGTGRGSIFKIKFTVANRGASLSFLSQYPAENEIAFPPGTLLSCTQEEELANGQRLLHLEAFSNPDTKLCEAVAHISSVAYTPEPSVFFCYSSTDEERVRQISENLAGDLQPFMSQRSAQRRSQDEICDTLLRSTVFVPFMSKEALAPLASFTQDSDVDPYFFQLRLALELRERGRLTILPVLIGQRKQSPELDFFTSFQSDNYYPKFTASVNVHQVEKQMQDFLRRRLGAENATPLVQEHTTPAILNEFLAHQAVLVQGGPYDRILKHVAQEISEFCHGQSHAVLVKDKFNPDHPWEPFAVDPYVPEYIIASGSYGIVCRARKADGSVVAIKKLPGVFDEASVETDVTEEKVHVKEEYERTARMRAVAGMGSEMTLEQRLAQTETAIRRSALEKARSTLREITVLSRLPEHPNLLKARFLLPPRPSARTFRDVYVVTDYLDTDLFHVVKTTPKHVELPVDHIFRQLLSAVDFLHRAKLIHRDLKPSNVLANMDGLVRIADFGQARTTLSALASTPSRDFENEKKFTMTSTVGSVGFRAPEILLSERAETERAKYGPAVDIWSLGMILTFMLTREELAAPFIACMVHMEEIAPIFHQLGAPTISDMEALKDYRVKSEIKQLLNVVRMRCDDTIYNPDLYEPPDISRLPLYQQLDRSAFVTENRKDLVSKLLQYNPKKRIKASVALQHACFEGMLQPLTLQELSDVESDYIHQGLDRLNSADLEWDYLRRCYHEESLGPKAALGKAPIQLSIGRSTLEPLSQTKPPALKQSSGSTLTVSLPPDNVDMDMKADDSVDVDLSPLHLTPEPLLKKVEEVYALGHKKYKVAAGDSKPCVPWTSIAKALVAVLTVRRSTILRVRLCAF